MSLATLKLLLVSLRFEKVVSFTYEMCRNINKANLVKP